MRNISYNNENIDYTCASTLSSKWDEKNPKVDTEYLIINCSVVGQSAGRKSIESDDTSSAWAAVHGRKYNNARISIPFEREFVSAHMSEIETLTSNIAAKCTGACGIVQNMMSTEEKAEGREAAMRSQAIREAKDDLQAGGAVIDQDLFNEANRSVRADVASKVVFEYGVSVSARRIKDTEGLQDKRQFKRKNITVGNSPEIGYVVTMDEKGLKKVPLMTQAMRDKAEKYVLDFAKVIVEEISKICDDPTSERCLAAVRAISKKMPGDEKVSVKIPEYTEAEKAKIAQWKEEVISNYKS